MYADLHVHSTYSDGTDTPAELLGMASAAGIRVLAISDHDTVEGTKAAQALQKTDVRLIPALEISTIANRRYAHILGYYIDVNSPALADYIVRASAEKTENTRINFEAAVADGCVDGDWQRVLELNPGQPRLSGVHVVHAMELGGCALRGITRREMFWKYFRPEGDRFAQTETTTVRDAIDVIHEAGGVPVIAHPKLVGDDAMVLEMIRCGARGIEARYPLHTAEEVLKYEEMAREYKLFVTGGSDWHGKNSAPAITHMGIAGLPDENYEILGIGAQPRKL